MDSASILRLIAQTRIHAPLMHVPVAIVFIRPSVTITTSAPPTNASMALVFSLQLIAMTVTPALKILAMLLRAV